jgi:hypothetical protein
MAWSIRQEECLSTNPQMAGLAQRIRVSQIHIIWLRKLTMALSESPVFLSPPRPPQFTGAERKYTQIKELGDGSFGTVWLCDWHSPIRSEHMLSAMQCGAGSRPEWVGKRLVALKMMKKVWDGGWDQAKTLGELAVSLIVGSSSMELTV